MPIDPCPHRPPCPGCPRFGEPGPPRDAREALEALARDAGLASPRHHEGAATAYRERARLAVRGRARSPKVGLFQAGSHRIVDTPRCPIHHPALNEAVAEIKQAIRETNTPPYVEPAGRGLLRYLQLVVEPGTRRLQIVLVGACDREEPLRPLAEAVLARMGDRVQGLFVNGQPEPTNTILGPHWFHVAGEPVLRVEQAGARIFFPPGAFGQSHRALASRIVERVHGWVGESGPIAELFAGVGAIGLGLAARGRRVHFNERSSDGLEGLLLGIDALPASLRESVHVFPGDASDCSEALECCPTVIVDPPRRGLGAGLITRLVQVRPERLIYVACGWRAFVEDCNRLRAGGLRLAALETWNLFPYTEHVETLAVFESPHDRP